MHRCIVVYGRVQGVGFRHSTIREMQRIGVCGTAQNLPNGSVEIHAEGPLEAVEALTHWAQKGPFGAKVNELVSAEEPVVGLIGTTILR